MYRQGDVLIIQCENIPINSKIINKENESIILAYGEATGHKHAIHSNDANLYAANDDDVYLEILKTVNLSHEEHSTISIPQGKYKVIIQKEYTPDGYRNVYD